MLLTLGRRAPSPDRSLSYQCLCGAASLPWLRWWWFFRRPAMQPATEGRGAAVNQPYQRWTPREWMRCLSCTVSYQQHLILPLRRWLNRSQPWHSSYTGHAAWSTSTRLDHYLCTWGPGVSCSSPGENSGGQLSWALGNGAPGVASLVVIHVWMCFIRWSYLLLSQKNRTIQNIAIAVSVPLTIPAFLCGFHMPLPPH